MEPLLLDLEINKYVKQIPQEKKASVLDFLKFVTQQARSEAERIGDDRALWEDDTPLKDAGLRGIFATYTTPELIANEDKLLQEALVEHYKAKYNLG